MAKFDKICTVCGKEFIAKSNNGKYCSYDCNYIGRREIRRARHGTGEHDKKCEHCSKEFKTFKFEQRFCSRKCAKDFWNHKGNRFGYNYTCEVCGKEFFTKSHGKKFCSSECRKARANATKRHTRTFVTGQKDLFKNALKSAYEKRKAV